MSVTPQLKEYFGQLSKVEGDIKAVQGQVEELLHKQQLLQRKKRELEREIKKIQKGVGSSSKDDNFTRNDFAWSVQLDELRSGVFRIDEYRPHQLEVMNATLSGRDVILIMPTGGGKSLCFQLPSLVSKGITLVVSPLVSLMEDQLMSLDAVGVHAALLNANSTREHKNEVHKSMLDSKPDLKILYVTPEKIAKSKMFMSKLEKMYKSGNFSRIVIDEIHCCSQWGHDFRPDYKKLGILKRQFPEVPLLGLTATATQHILNDVKTLLNVPYCMILRASYDRPNLYYEVRRKPRKHDECIADMSNLLTGKFKGQSGIIYCFSRKESETIASDLRKLGIDAMPYHADVDASTRSHVHHAWTKGTIQVVVATIAFGMGIDKPNVRFVIHHTLSKSVENYYQESGRAGRDGLPAFCILYYGFGDVFRQSTMVMRETQTSIDNLYNMVRYCTNIERCKRSSIARHFDESWDFIECNGMCDICREKKLCDDSGLEFVQTRDITVHCQDLYAILDKAASLDKRLTANKLIEIWMKKGSDAKLRIKDQKIPSITSDRCEDIVCHLLLEGYLSEDYHFTPYATLSYVIPGTKQQLVTSMGQRIELTLRVKGQKVNDLPDLNLDVKVKGAKPKSQSLDVRKDTHHDACITISDDEIECDYPQCTTLLADKDVSMATGGLVAKHSQSNSEKKITKIGISKKDKSKVMRKRKGVDDGVNLSKKRKDGMISDKSVNSSQDESLNSEDEFAMIRTVYTEQLQQINTDDDTPTGLPRKVDKKRKKKKVPTATLR